MKRLTPNGWTWATLGQCARRITDGTHQPPLFEDQGVPFVFVKHVVRGRLSFEGTKFISSDTFAALNRRCPVERGDILYTAVGSYGVAVLVDTDRPFSFQRHIAHIKLSTSLDAGYFVHCLNSPFVRQQADVVARGVAQKTVTLGDLTNFILPIPPLREQQRIRTELERRFSITETLEATTERLVHRARTMRQAILQAAFSGGLPGQRPVRRATLHDDSGVLGRPLAAAPLQDGV
jgi:type I restriction enzyme S subunit